MENKNPQVPQQPVLPYGNSNYCTSVRKRKEEKKIDFSMSDYIFFCVFAVLSICLVFFGFFCQMALGYTLSTIALVTALVVYIIKHGKVSFLSVSCLVLIVLSSVVFTLYGNDYISRFIAFAVLFVSTVICTTSLTDKTIADNLDGVFKLIRTFIAPIENAPTIAKSVLKNDKKKTVLQVGGAVLAAIPVLAIVISLLVSADAAFEGLVDKIASTLGMSVLKLIVSVVVFVGVVLFAVTCKYELNKSESKPFQLDKTRFINTPFAITFLGLIALVYLIYMFSQTAYFFSAFSGILPAGYEFSFSEYARRGFFETEAIAFINLVIMVLSVWLTVRRDNGTLNPVIKGILTFIGVFTILFIATAISKMVMYIDEYGLTVLRLCTSAFMLATAIVIIAFIIRVFKPELKTIKYAVLISMLIFTVLSLFGIERTIADYNVNAYLNGKHENIDMYTLGELSDSAIPYIAKLTKCDDEFISQYANEIIYDLYDWTIGTEHVIYDAAETKTYKAKYEATADFSLSEYFATKAFNDAGIPYRYPEVEDYDYSYDQSIEDDYVDWDEV